MIESLAFSFWASFSTDALKLYGAALILSFAFLSANTLFYLICVPKNIPVLSKQKGVSLAVGMAGILSILRLPFAVIPYFAKAIFYLSLRKKFTATWSSDVCQATRIAGDFLNLGISFVIWQTLTPVAATPLWLLAATAEILRLTFEKGFIVFSVVWQRLPLENISQRLLQSGIKNDWLEYYARSRDEKLVVLQNAASRLTSSDSRFRYFSRFEISPRSVNLRAGRVRGIAGGEIFIHAEWTNDPHLLLGLCARRSAWIFDPRYLQRPFYYRSQANGLMTRFVLEHATLFPPFAFYQFGHEIKSARFGIFFKAARALGLELEQPVQKDGAYLFDPLLARLGAALGFEDLPKNIPLYDDAAVIFETAERIKQGQSVAPNAIAEEFSYPLIYVEEVLWRKIEDVINSQKNQGIWELP